MRDEIEALGGRLREIEAEIADPTIYRDRLRHGSLMREHAHITKVLAANRRYEESERRLREALDMAANEESADLRDLAKSEAESLTEQVKTERVLLANLLLPHNPIDDKNAIVEIRAGTGGDEASLFVGDLYRMYTRYAERRGWQYDLLVTNSTDVGGFREIVFSVSGTKAFGTLKVESGVHRVQRVPVTESSGRLHTSAVSVVVLPEIEETEVTIGPEELRIDVYRSSGPGGQSVNTTDSAVRINHLPTGLVVTCQDEKSQHKNKAKALRVLRARLFELEEQKRHRERDATRRTQIGSGDRSERIRTYNFPQNRFTDHRINLTLYRLDHIIEGDMDEVIEQLRSEDAPRTPARRGSP